MSIVDKAIETQLKNIQAKTGKTLDQLGALLRTSGLTKHGELRDFAKRELGLGHGDANTLVHVCFKSDGASAAEASGASTDDVLAAIYSGPKATLRPIHDAFMAEIGKFGEFEIAPKKGYVSLRRKKQFATLGPATKDQVELGLNAKALPATARLKSLPPGGMCQYSVRLSTTHDVDAELMQWVRAAYDAAG